MKETLTGLAQAELEELAVREGLRSFAGRQLARWLYVRRAKSFEEMTDLPREARLRFAERYDIGRHAPLDCATSKDGTRKYLFEVEASTGSGTCRSCIETVMIPEEDRRTLCISSQAGCKMNCRFCMTGRQGWHGNLQAADILNQLMSVDEAADLTNVVFMGMGEPLDNYDAVLRTINVMTADWGFAWSPKRITVSTIGVLPNLKRLLDETRCHVAVSLHNPFPQERAGLMPVQKTYPIEEVVRLLKQYDFSGQRRVSFEYTMFEGWNDSHAHADALVRLLRPLECRINLIRFHRIPDFPMRPSPDSVMEHFRDRLNQAGITTTIRASRGEDVMAACGLLAGAHKNL